MSFLDSVPVIGSRRKSKRADKIVKDAKYKHQKAEDRLEECQRISQAHIDSLFDVKTECAVSVIPKALEVIERCQTVNRLDTNVAKDSFDSFNANTVPALKDISVTTKQVISTGVKGSSAGAALALGSMGLVSTYGAATTGTAIASLSGIAAQNATMAWFGGGALAAGGAGMAGGAMVLGGIALAPLAIIGAWKYASHAEEKLTSAVEFENEVEVSVEAINSVIAIANSLNKHILLYQDMLEGLIARLVSSSKALDDSLESNESLEQVNIHKVHTILLIKAIKRVLEVELCTNDQRPTQDSLAIIQHMHNAKTPEVNELVENICNDQVITIPKGIKSIEDVEPGIDSPKFFWFQGEKLPVRKLGKMKKFILAFFLANILMSILVILFDSSSMGSSAVNVFDPVDANESECTDTSFIRQNSSQIYIKLFNNSEVNPKPNDGGSLKVFSVSNNCEFVALEASYAMGFHLVKEWHVLDRSTGMYSTLMAKPLFSPDNKYIITYNEDLDAGYSPNIFNLYSLRPEGAVQVFKGVREGDEWGPADVRWINDDKVYFKEVRLNDGSSSDFYIEKEAMLVNSDGIWKII